MDRDRDKGKGMNVQEQLACFVFVACLLGCFSALGQLFGFGRKGSGVCVPVVGLFLAFLENVNHSVTWDRGLVGTFTSRSTMGSKSCMAPNMKGYTPIEHFFVSTCVVKKHVGHVLAASTSSPIAAGSFHGEGLSGIAGLGCRIFLLGRS